jgi:hypothetical protein
MLSIFTHNSALGWLTTLHIRDYLLTFVFETGWYVTLVSGIIELGNQLYQGHINYFLIS